MTQREFFVAVSKADVAEDIKEKALELIANLDKKNANRSSKPNKTQKANAEIKPFILDYLASLNGEYAPASDVAECNERITSTSHASSLLRQLVAEGKVESVDNMKFEGKKSKSKGYRLVTSE